MGPRRVRDQLVPEDQLAIDATCPCRISKHRPRLKGACVWMCLFVFYVSKYLRACNCWCCIDCVNNCLENLPIVITEPRKYLRLRIFNIAKFNIVAITLLQETKSKHTAQWSLQNLNNELPITHFTGWGLCSQPGRLNNPLQFRHELFARTRFPSPIIHCKPATSNLAAQDFQSQATIDGSLALLFDFQILFIHQMQYQQLDVSYVLKESMNFENLNNRWPQSPPGVANSARAFFRNKLVTDRPGTTLQ